MNLKDIIVYNKNLENRIKLEDRTYTASEATMAWKEDHFNLIREIWADAYQRHFRRVDEQINNRISENQALTEDFRE